MTRPSAVRWADGRLVEIVARTPHGAVLHPWWPLPFDGLLSAAARRIRLGELYGVAVDHHGDRLPLCRLRLGTGKRWSWAASCARFDAVGEEVRWRHRRVDWQAAIDRSVRVPPVLREQGRYRTWRLPTIVTLAGELRWWACGDPEAIRALVAPVRSVGRHRGRGEGLVTKWTIRDVGPPDIDPILWDGDGRIGRPLSSRAAPALGLDDPDIVEGAYRPPYWRAPQGEDGTARRTWRPIIAPWTVRPGMMELPR